MMNRHSPLLNALLSPAQMGHADQMTIEAGTPGIELMERAGRAIFDRVLTAYPDAQTIHVLCGPGNNGGDGFVVAELLRQAGRTVRLSTLGSPDDLKGDAALAFRQWRGETIALHPADLREADLLIDAVFGAGLDRPAEGTAAAYIIAMNNSGAPILSVDLPSGVCGATGRVGRDTVHADDTVTFFRKKPGHLLNPGKAHCGNISVADIGISDETLENLGVTSYENAPGLWQAHWPGYCENVNKYTRGHAMVVSGGPLSTGASRLSAVNALRVGAGLVSLVGSPDALMVHAAHVTSVMLKPASTPQELKELLSDVRVSAAAIGPALGTDAEARKLVDIALSCPPALTLDADVFTLFADDPPALFDWLKHRDRTCVLTPHVGEFKRLFGAIPQDGNRLEATKEAAELSGGIVVLKGSDTIIAEPGGRAAINSNAPPWLATAGSGDVLTGIITGLMAQGMPAFEAACAGVWLHGEAGNRCGPYLIADDLESGLAEVLEEDSHDWSLPDDE